MTYPTTTPTKQHSALLACKRLGIDVDSLEELTGKQRQQVTSHFPQFLDVFASVPLPRQLPPPSLAGCLVDPIRRAAIRLPKVKPSGDVCLATVVSPGFESWLDTFMGSVEVWGCANDFVKVCFVVDDLEGDCRKLAESYGWQVIDCHSLTTINAGIKAVMYSVSQVVDAKHYLCLDADMLVFHDLRELVSESRRNPGRILLTNNDNADHPPKLGEQFVRLYKGAKHELACFCGSAGDFQRIDDCPFVVNDGMLCGDRQAFDALDKTIRDMPSAVEWIDHDSRVAFRNQFSLNAAIARLGCGKKTDDLWNVQLHFTRVDRWIETAGGIRPEWKGKLVKILHFTGPTKELYERERLFYGQLSGNSG